MQTEANPKGEPKRALEQAISKIGKAYGDLLRVAEKHGHEIGQTDYDKARFFLDSTIGKIWEKIDVVRDVAKATNGDFSLDSIELPETETLQIRTATGVKEWQVPKGAPFATPAVMPVVPAGPIDASRMDGRSLAQAIGGRLTKQAKAAIPRPTQSVNTDLDDDLGPTDTSFEDDGADFIDE
ncbi:hypothetical protein B7L88_gp054 [Rhizobium phage RHEph10]|uniref:hypothetical protein n=1 Tax=Rhizobium phage RHEph10 TaxID=1220717 RepID=UPI0002AAFA58|nr:hypothetical protein B7L88_gp054 [Rhizobium phage RHEph10]AGC36098.1 hypothetical protein RHEph10_gp054 [Rhizobium phage RHEph10]